MRFFGGRKGTWRTWIVGISGIGLLLGSPAVASRGKAVRLEISSKAEVVSVEDRQELAARVDSVFAPWDRSDSPGCALGIVKDGQLVYARGYGMANLEHSIPIAPRTVFDIGSTAKQFTAASILLLEQQGKLSRDDDIRRFLPEIPDYGRPITIRHLLHHTSGLRDYLTLMALAGIHFDGVTTEEDALRIIARQKGLNFAPGEDYLYSNSGYFLLSLIVKRVSGRSLREFAEENIFRPLGMKSTQFQDDHTRIIPHRATGYAPAPSGGFRLNMSQFEQTGDGALWTTVEDLVLWDRNFYEPKVGGPDLIRQLLEPGRLLSGETVAYAAGLIKGTYRGLTVIRHGGSWAGYRAELLRFPEQRFSVICLCNLSTINPTRLAYQVADLYLASAFPDRERDRSPERAFLSGDEIRARIGIYQNPKARTVLRLSLSPAPGAGISLEGFGSRFDLELVAKGRARLTDSPFSAEIVFEEDTTGGTGGRPSMRLRIRRPGRPDEIYEKIEPVTLSPERLRAYEGTYESEELDVSYTLVREGNRLVVRARGIPAYPLTYLRGDDFLSLAGLHYAFERDAQGRITGFLLNAGRARGLRFVRRSPAP